MRPRGQPSPSGSPHQSPINPITPPSLPTFKAKHTYIPVVCLPTPIYLHIPSHPLPSRRVASIHPKPSPIPIIPHSPQSHNTSPPPLPVSAPPPLPHPTTTTTHTTGNLAILAAPSPTREREREKRTNERHGRENAAFRLRGRGGRIGRGWLLWWWCGGVS